VPSFFGLASLVARQDAMASLVIPKDIHYEETSGELTGILG
jgi:hypothetical protein